MSVPPRGACGLSATRLQLARWATRLQFLLFGFIVGVWGVHIPSVKAQYALDEGALSLVLWALATGSVLCLTQAARIVAGLGARVAALTASVLMCASLAAALVSDVFAALVGTVLVFGAACALFDVAINAEGSQLEAASGKKVMSGFHGMFSLGGMLGAAAGALALRAQVPPPLQLASAAAFAAALAVAASAGMLARDGRSDAAEPRWRVPRGVLAQLGLLASVALMAEGAMVDWSVLYLQQEMAASPALAALGFASFSGAMAAARFGGDGLRSRIEGRRLLVGSGLVAAGAMTLLLAARDPWIALFALAGVGAGLANVVPILFSAASRVPDVAPAEGIAAVSSLGYLGMVAGPLLIGGIAEASSLGVGLGAVVLAALVLAAGARRLTP
ncbi:MAG: MFS transporter [Burkholderiaceae bacterium]